MMFFLWFLVLWFFLRIVAATECQFINSQKGTYLSSIIGVYQLLISENQVIQKMELIVRWFGGDGQGDLDVMKVYNT